MAKEKIGVFEEKKIAENDIAIFYENYFSNQLSEQGKELDITCIVAERKDSGLKEYILMNEKNEGIYSSTDSEAVYWRLVAIKKSKELV